jgi:hypothetical protein
MNRLKSSLNLFLSVSVLLLFNSCAKDSAAPPKPESVNCDSINYTQDIAPIIEKNCSVAGCHVEPAPTGPGVLLNTYTLLVDKAISGRIKARVLDGKPSFMPYGGELKPEEKKLIECWLNNGYKF